MSYISKLSQKMLCIIALISLPIKSTEEIIDNKDQQHKLHNFIYHVADRLYCEAEMNGGGDNGKNYKIIINKNIEEFKNLLKSEKDFINYQDDYGRSPLMIAAYTHIWEFIELLIDKGADTHLKTKDGYTTLDLIKLGASWGQPGSIQFIIKLVMMNYYTKERHNECVDLLANTLRERMWYKRWM